MNSFIRNKYRCSFRHNCIICTFDSVSGSVIPFFNLSISSSFTFISRLCSATASFTKSSQHISVKKPTGHDGLNECHSRNDIVRMAILLVHCFMTNMTSSFHKNPCHRGHEIQNLSRTFLAQNS